MAEDSRLEAKITRRFLPFAAVGLVGLAATALPPRPQDWSFVWAAGVLTLLIALAGVLIPWSRIPRWTYVLPPLAYFVVVALLREASDGSVSGYAPLALLPVVWIALNLGRREVALGIALGASVLVLPLFVGDPEAYTASDWRRALVWTTVAIIIGFSVESIMREKRSQTRIAREHERTIAAIAGVARALTAETDAREHICRASLEIAGASFAAIWEPDGYGDLVLTGHAGPELGRVRFSMREDVSGGLRAFETGAAYFSADAPNDPSLPQEEIRRAGVVSMLFEPIVRGDTTVGVLGVGWDRRVEGIEQPLAQAVRLLAIEAAVAIERADLLAGLSRMAETDELTGLANRRAWDETIRRAVGYASRTHRPLCVAVLDLDRFKAFNDEHGHQAGDRLLKASAAEWQTALRQTDTLARYGGEEFGVVLPSCALSEAEAVLERLRSLTPDGQTCSVGLSQWAPGESAAELVARADRALYDAKRNGRDALVIG